MRLMAVSVLRVWREGVSLRPRIALAGDSTVSPYSGSLLPGSFTMSPSWLALPTFHVGSLSVIEQLFARIRRGVLIRSAAQTPMGTACNRDCIAPDGDVAL